MAAFFSSSNNQRESASMLYLREPISNQYSETPVLVGNMVTYMDYASSAGTFSDALPGNSRQQIDMPAAASDSAPPQQEILSSLGGSSVEENGYSAWRDGRNEMLFMHPMGGSPTTILHGGQNLQGQGLSISLGTQIPSGIQMPSVQYRNRNPGFSAFLGPNSSISGEAGSRSGSFRDDENSLSKHLPPGYPGVNQELVKGDPSPYSMSSIARTIPNSKYLKAAQQLLDEVVNVRKALKRPDSEAQMKGSKEVDGGSKSATASQSANGAPSNPQGSTANSAPELSPAERQELQNKVTKLLSMLDEVDRRYKQYYHQMHIVVSSFDVIAGSGAARPYTALALQTISCHFRCLRDAITGQIRATRKSLGEQDTSASSRGVGIARLRYVDQQIRQQRALQQLGVMQPHAWRPQRGLPESSVSILRAWLFEHFLHPYPKDSDKIMLARQTGLTRSQVSNWFINARVRLWKPMVEEMYKEEFGEAELDSNSSSENAPRMIKPDLRASEDRGEDMQQSGNLTATKGCSVVKFHISKSEHIPDADMTGPGPTTGTGFRNGNCEETETEFGIVKLRGDLRPNLGDCSLIPEAFVRSDGGSERFMAAAAAYDMSELGRFGSGSGVSLTLGLQRCEDGTLPMSGVTHHNFVMTRGDDIYNAAASSVVPETAEFDCIDPGNRQHRLGSSHLLHDFVA
ncbi:POX domain [Dillenia turbinata]|uniref:POX domain n=1 Tax=Dillenia turbinata TaxID=194707 RepID=A0AAN8UPH3_9MAGN